MKKFNSRADPELADMIRGGSVGILRTDTLYGLVASAHDSAAVERVYTIRNRDLQKPCIVLIHSVDQIWDRELICDYEEVIHRYWPGKVSIILPVGLKTPTFVHREYNGTVAFRMPADEELSQLLISTGPLIVPSANPAGQLPAMNIEQAEQYFGEAVDFYVDSGVCQNPEPSRLIQPTSGSNVEVLR